MYTNLTKFRIQHLLSDSALKSSVLREIIQSLNNSIHSTMQSGASIPNLPMAPNVPWTILGGLKGLM